MFQEKAKAFLALPAGHATSADLASEIGDALREQGLEPVWFTEPGVMDQTQSGIRRAEVVVADLTGSNPNVLFEVGFALGLSKPVLLLSQEPAGGVPFDLHTQQ